MPSVQDVSLKNLTHTFVMLIALVIAQRVQIIHQLDTNHMIKESSGYTFVLDGHVKQSKPDFHNPVIKLTKYTEDSKLCVRSVCTE